MDASTFKSACSFGLQYYMSETESNVQLHRKKVKLSRFAILEIAVAANKKKGILAAWQASPHSISSDKDLVGWHGRLACTLCCISHSEFLWSRVHALSCFSLDCYGRQKEGILICIKPGFYILSLNGVLFSLVISAYCIYLLICLLKNLLGQWQSYLYP